MSRGGKDSAEVVKFMTLFARLKHWSDDAPDELPDRRQRKGAVHPALFCRTFPQDERARARALFAAPVDPGFLEAWRDYEERYESVVSDIWAGDLLDLFDVLPELSTNEPSRIPKADLQWKNADDEAQEQAGGIEEAIAF